MRPSPSKVTHSWCKYKHLLSAIENTTMYFWSTLSDLSALYFVPCQWIPSCVTHRTFWRIWLKQSTTRVNGMSETGLYGGGGIRRNKSPYFRHAPFRAASDGSASRGLWSCVLSNLAVCFTFNGEFPPSNINLYDLISQPNRKCDVSLDLYCEEGSILKTCALLYGVKVWRRSRRETHAPRRKEHGLLSLPHFFCYCLHFGFDPAQLLLPATSALASPQPASTARRVSVSFSLSFSAQRVCVCGRAELS